MSGRGDAERIGELVREFLDRSGAGEQLARVDALALWPGAVGEAIARVTRARSVEGSTLVVEVRSSAWLMELNMMKGDILRRLNEGREDGRIERLVFVLAGKPDGPRSTP